MLIHITKTNSDAVIPKQGTSLAAGFDLVSTETLNVRAHSRTLIPTGLRMAIQAGYEGQIRPRSGMALKQGIAAILGTIDADYRGDVGIILANTTDKDYVAEKGTRLAQIVFNQLPDVHIIEVEHLPEPNSNRTGGFGHTGE